MKTDESFFDRVEQ